MLYLASIVVAVALLACVIGLSFFLKWLAQENILVTTVKEGTVKAIMRGDSLDHFIMSFSGYHLNDPKKSWHMSCPVLKELDTKSNFCEWDVIYHGDENDARYDDRFWPLKKLGLYWVGWPWAMQVYVYQFEWNETYMDEKGKTRVLPRAEATDHIFVSDFTYAIVTEDAETKDRLPTNELSLVTVAIRNPYRALFSGENWMRRVDAAINRHMRSFVGSKNFQQLISPKKKDAGWKELSARIIELTEKLPDDKEGYPPFGLKGRYGAEIRTADLQIIELSGDAKRQDQEATTKQYVAVQIAKEITLTGQAKANVIEMIGDKEAIALRKRLAVIKEHGEMGITLAGFDAIQESSKGPGNTIIWAGDPLASLAKMFTKDKGDEK